LTGSTGRHWSNNDEAFGDFPYPLPGWRTSLGETRDRLHASKMPIKRKRVLPSWFPQWIQRRVEMDSYALFEFIEETSASLGRGVRVLDAGAGECQYRDLFSDVRYVGVDLAVGEPEWDYRCLDAFSDVTALPFAAQTFDAVLCFQVLEHLPEPLQALCEFRRVMSPGGRLFLSTPQSWHQHQKPHDYFRYTSFGLRYLMQKAGLALMNTTCLIS